eukprot:GHVS01019091.1.p1 GENE.GHVS01019091.1~~GHVS01019091.1.p1  ORF type:complete len:143 (-),score=15.91 GHVS01019091.1:407-835(-)
MALLSDIWMSRWLLFVSLFRALSMYWSYFKPGVIAERVFDLIPNHVSQTTTHLFGVWTCLSGVLCVTCALNLYNKPLFYVTIFSFLLAFLFFLSEYSVYQSMSNKGFKFPAIMSCVTMVWMLAFALQSSATREAGRSASHRD